MVWTSVTGAAGDQVTIQSAAGMPADWALFVATGADYQPPQEWKRAGHEAGPMGATITRFDSGELIIYL